MKTLSIPAPAKINLSLKIVKKRDDGFHELETVMAPLSGLHDSLLFEEDESFSFFCDQEGVPTDESNLVVKAVRLFEVAAGVQVRYKVTLEKRVPHGAGLGGGSSDAASCLLALNELYDSPLTFQSLYELASELGSDVPFFLYESPCLCRGRGEIIETITPVAPTPLVLLKPDFGVSTTDAFKRWQNSKTLAGISYETQFGPYGEMSNDLERPVFEKFLFLAELKRWLLAQEEVSVAQMSGSGSTMIALLHDIQDAETLVIRAKKECDPHLFSWAGYV